MPNVIGDVAGQLDTLLALIEQMPKEEIILVGDLIDRGPKSKEVVEWAMKNATVLKGNHEDMMVDHVRVERRYEKGIWFMNGGDATLKSYGIPNKEDVFDGDVFDPKFLMQHIPEEHVQWMESLPIFIERDNIWITHAPFNMYLDPEATKQKSLANGLSLVWNRDIPPYIEGKLQLFGHNSNWGLRRFIDTKKSLEPYAICLDNSQHSQLLGYNTNTKQIFNQTYI